MLATTREHFQIVQALLNHGSKTDLRDEVGAGGWDPATIIVLPTFCVSLDILALTSLSWHLSSLLLTTNFLLFVARATAWLHGSSHGCQRAEPRDGASFG